MVRHKKRKGIFGITARALMLLAAGILVMSYLSVIVNPAKAWFMTFFGLLFVPAALLNLFLLLWGIRRGSRAAMIPLVALIPGLIFMGRHFQISGKRIEDNSNAIKIITYNVGRFSSSKKTTDIQECADSIAAFLKKEDADIICLQEFRLPGGTDIKKYFKKHFPEYQAEYYMYLDKKTSYGNVTLSKFPIKGKGKFEFDQSANLAIYTDLVINEQNLRLYNCHFESYNISIAKIASRLRQKDDEVMRETEDKMKKSIIRRPEQVEEVFSNIENCSSEAIVIGDFNDGPLSYTYYRLSKGCDDSFVEAGKGFGATYASLWPLIRIDYILYPKHFTATSHRTPRIKFSDHFPVIAKINFDQQ